MLYAYRALLMPMDDIGEATLESHRAHVRAKIEQWGGDPLPTEQVMLRISESGQITLKWRSRRSPQSGLIESVADYAAGLDLIGWRLDYHQCGNGVGRRCGRWQELINGGLV